MLSLKPSISVQAKYWTRDGTDGIYDYSDTKLIQSSLKVTSPGALSLEDNSIVLSSENSDSLADIELIRGHFCVSPAKSTESDLWLVVRYLNSPYRLSEGDEIKLGKTNLRVKEIKSRGDIVEDFSMRELVYGEDSEEESEIEDHELACRVCLNGKSESHNPLISPCNCGGTMKYIHLKCFQNSLKAHMISQSSSHAISIAWNKILCDLCQKVFPKKIKVQGKPVNLIEFSKPPGSYLVLENQAENSMVLISFACTSRVKVGRSPDCDVILSDMAVSRVHSSISYINGAFLIEDLKSRYGTLVKISRPISLEMYSPIFLQNRKTLISLKYNKGLGIIPGCFTSKNNPFEYIANPYMGGVTLFPFNTGIPISVSDPQKLSAIMGMNSRVAVRSFEKHNLSSDSCGEEVEVADDIGGLQTII